MPTTPQDKAIRSRNATPDGLFARDIVLPSLDEDPEGYRWLEAEWMSQLAPHNLLERHYVEKIAAASWRLRRLHRWQAQLFEDDTLTEDERMDRLDKVLRHETALHRQIDTSMKMLNRDVPQLYAGRTRDQGMEAAQLSERECRQNARSAAEVDLETRGRLRRIRKATEQASDALAQAVLGTKGGAADVNCENEPNHGDVSSSEGRPSSERDLFPRAALRPDAARFCENELLEGPVRPNLPRPSLTEKDRQRNP